MIKSSIIVIGLGIVALAVLYSKGAFGSKLNDVPTLKDFGKQQEYAIGTTQANIGAVNLPEGKAYDSSAVKSNIVSSNLFTEQALRDLVNKELGKRETATITTSGTEVNTKQIRDLDISNPKSLELFRNDDSSLIVHDAFNPIGSASVTSIRGKLTSPLSNVKAKTQKTFSATITTRSGGTRNILVTEETLKKLQSRLAQTSTL